MISVTEERRSRSGFSLLRCDFDRRRLAALISSVVERCHCVTVDFPWLNITIAVARRFARLAHFRRSAGARSAVYSIAGNVRRRAAIPQQLDTSGGRDSGQIGWLRRRKPILRRNGHFGGSWADGVNITTG